MDPSFYQQFSWSGFLSLFLGLLILFFVLHAAKRIAQRTSALGHFQQVIIYGIQQILLIYEPFGVFILAAAFVLVNPFFHGFLFVVLLIGGFQHLKNYISGQIIQFENPNLKGKRLRTIGIEGIIAHTGRLGLYLETSEGLHTISYSSLNTNGFTLLSGEDVGGVFKLRIKGVSPQNPMQLIDLLATAPYVDWNHKPELLPSFEVDESIQVRVWVQEEGHLYDLLELIKEWGYSPKVSN